MLLETILKRTIKVLELFLITITVFYYITNVFICIHSYKILSFYFLSLSLFYYIKTIKKSENTTLNKDVVGVCTICHLLKYRHTRHCLFCDQCFDERSHHCAWISGCVYNGNKNDFVFFITFLVLHGFSNFNCLNCFVVLMGAGTLGFYFFKGNRLDLETLKPLYVFLPWLERKAKVIETY